MSGESFDKMSGLTFADFPQGVNGAEADPEPKDPNPEIESAFHKERELRAMCPHCQTVGTGTFEQLELHMAQCRASA